MFVARSIACVDLIDESGGHDEDGDDGDDDIDLKIEKRKDLIFTKFFIYRI